MAIQLLSEFDNSISNERANINDESASDDEFNGQKSLHFIWIEGLRTGSRLVWVPSEESIYYTNAISKKHTAIACTCIQKDCKERILIMEDGSATRETSVVNHTHGSLYHIYKERILYTYMKERCRTAPASAVIRDIYNEAVLQ